MSAVTFIYDQIRGAPNLLPMIGWYERELIRRRTPSSWKLKDFYYCAAILYNEEPLTMMLFAPIKEESHRCVYNAGAFTLPSWRRNGLYTDLLNICLNEWRKDDLYDWYRGGYHKDNKASEAMQRRQGRDIYEMTDTHYRTRISLRPTGNEFELTNENLRPLLDKLDYLSG